MNKITCHFKLITTHKWYVFKNCCKAGIPWRGIKHDLSKYSPTEFFESAKYFTGDRSPIDNCKDANGVSYAWQHHKGRNPHHWEYWIDEVGSDNPVGRLMPYKYAVEMICDYIGAGQAYEKESWSPQSQYEWWQNKKEHVKMHPQIYSFVNICMAELRTMGVDYILNPHRLKYIWRSLEC